MDKAEEICVLDQRVRLLQAAGGFCTSLDSVMLAAACPVKTGEHVLDLGCGVGSAGLCVLKRVEGAQLTGVDLQADHIELARRNAALNDMAERCSFMCADVRGYDGGPFDHIICNPPYNEAGAHTRSPSEAKALAMGHAEASLQDWLDAGCKLLKHGGTLSIIHKAEMLDKILQGFKTRFGAVEVIPLWPRIGVPAKRVIIRAVRNSKKPLTLHAGLTLHQDNGDYTEEAEKVLRGMGAIG